MYTIGIDLGGTNIVASVVDDDYNIIGTSKTPTNSPRSADEIFDDIADVCEEAVKTAGLTMEDIDSVGMGTPGTVNQDGVIEFANNLAFNNVPARTMLAKRINKPEEKVFIENDANCAALGEAYAGCGNGAKDFVAVTLGTGVGSGVIIGGKIVNGVNYAGGECGHMVIVVDGEQCSCGRKGCWEAYVYIKYVACGLINIVNALQPEIICIGGGICNEGETLMKPLRRFVQSERYSIHSKIQTKIVKAELGNDAGVIGAALLGKVK